MPCCFCILRPCLIYIPPPTGKPSKHNMTVSARFASNSQKRIIASGKRRMNGSPVSRKPPRLTPLLKTLSDPNRFSRLPKGSFFCKNILPKTNSSATIPSWYQSQYISCMSSLIRQDSEDRRVRLAQGLTVAM